MAQDIVGSLFGVSATDLQAQRQQAAQAQAMRYAQMNPAEQVNYGGYMAGNQVGNALMGMMGAKDPELEKATKLQQLTSQFDLTSEEGLLNAARTLASNGFQPQAMAMAQRAQEVSLNNAKIGKENALAKKANTEKSDVTDYKMKAWQELAKKSTPASVQASIDNGYSLADLSVSDNEKRSTTAQKLIEMGLVPGSPEFIKLMREDVEADIRGKGSSRGTTINMPGQGTPKLSDINPTIGKVREILGPASSAVSEADQALDLLDMDNPKADAQVDRALAKLSGDSQISMAEVLAVAQAGSFPQRVVDSASKFFTGTASELSKTQKAEVLLLLREAAASKVNRERGRLGDVYRTSELSEQQVNAVLGNPVTPRKPKKTEAATGGSTTKKGTKYQIID